MSMVTSRHVQEAGGVAGSAVSWLLASTGWGLHDWRDMTTIIATCAATLVSLVTVYFLIKNRGRKQ